MTTTHPQNEVSIEFLEAFGDAWNRQDIDTIMTSFTDCTAGYYRRVRIRKLRRT